MTELRIVVAGAAGRMGRTLIREIAATPDVEGSSFSIFVPSPAEFTPGSFRSPLVQMPRLRPASVADAVRARRYRFATRVGITPVIDSSANRR